MKKPTRQMAKTIGITPSTYSRIEQGESMDAKTLMRILDWLTGDEDPADE
jgi:transcriptional regulator with XRE-family HTH domain